MVAVAIRVNKSCNNRYFSLKKKYLRPIFPVRAYISKEFYAFNSFLYKCKYPVLKALGIVGMSRC